MPLGLDELILELLAKRVGYCDANHDRCESCRGTIRSGETDIADATAAPAHGHAGNGNPAAAGTCSTCPYAAAGVPMPAAAH